MNVDPNLMITFIVLTALAVALQTGVVIGLYIASSKINRQADRAIAETHRLFGPINRLAEILEERSGQFADLSANAPAKLKEAEGKLSTIVEWVRRRKQ